MKKSVLAVLVIIFIAALLTLTNGGPERRSFEITSVSINFDKNDATITVNYEFPKLMKLYILLLGSKGIEPKINATFPDFEYDIVKMNQNQAVLRATNISIYESGYYLHESKKLGTNINTVYIYTPDSPRPKLYSNIDSTPNIFYHA